MKKDDHIAIIQGALEKYVPLAAMVSMEESRPIQRKKQVAPPERPRKHYRTKSDQFSIYTLKEEHDNLENINSLKRTYGLGRSFKGYKIDHSTFIVRVVNQHGKQQDNQVTIFGSVIDMYETKENK